MKWLHKSGCWPAVANFSGHIPPMAPECQWGGQERLCERENPAVFLCKDWGRCRQGDRGAWYILCLDQMAAAVGTGPTGV